MNKVNKIQILKDLRVNNDTLRFLLPVLTAHGIVDNDILIEGFRGVYLQDENNLDLGDNLFIRYTPLKTEEYANIDAKITALEGYTADYDMGDDIVYVIDIKESFENVLKTFKAGEYSQFSAAHKQRIAEFWQLAEGANDPLSGVIHQTEVGKEQFQKLPEEIQKLTAENELWPRPHMADETLN